MKMKTLAFYGLCIVFVVLRLSDLFNYPRLEVDEGLFSIQAKDAVLFGDARMNAPRPDTVVVTPGHFSLTWTLFHVAPATIFSVRALNALLGCLTLWVVWTFCREHLGRPQAYWAVIVLGLSFSMITLNRRAWLETGVALISLLAVWFSAKTSRQSLIGLVVAVAALLLYKMNAIYIVPGLLLPSARESFWPGVTRRAAAIAVGAVVAVAVFYGVYRYNPGVFLAAYGAQLNLGGATEQPLIHVGRFGIFPHKLMETARNLVTGSTDLLALTALALGGVIMARRWYDRITGKLLLWLIGGYTLSSLQVNHVQYYVPLIVPAVLLTVAGLYSLPAGSLSFRTYRGLLSLTIVFSLARLAYGWHHARVDNPPLEALRWIESQDPAAASFLACPEIAAATEKKGYILDFVMHPSGPPAVDLVSVVQARQVKTIVYDEWESAPYFKGDQVFLDRLGQYRTVVSHDGWTGIRVP